MEAIHHDSDILSDMLPHHIIRRWATNYLESKAFEDMVLQTDAIHIRTSNVTLQNLSRKAVQTLYR